MSTVMEVTHTASMNLRFIERAVSPDGRTGRFLQQMFVPKDWSKYDEEWRDVPCVREHDVIANQSAP